MRFSILAFSVEKRHFHRKSQFSNRKPPKFECYSGFHGWGIDWKHYWMGPRLKNLEFLHFRYKHNGSYFTLQRELLHIGFRGQKNFFRKASRGKKLRETRW